MSQRYLLPAAHQTIRVGLLVIVTLVITCSQAISLAAARPGSLRRWHLAGTATQLARQHREQFQIPGMSVAIAQRGRIVYQQGFGYRNQEQLLPATAQTRYRLASISKSVTSVLAMLLVEQGRLDLDRNLGGYLPNLSKDHRAIRLPQLLSHQSGIRHYEPNDPDTLKFEYCHKAISFFQDDALKFSPGERFLYSTHAYTMLGAALEKATDKSFRQLVIDEITIKQNLPTLRPEDRSINDPQRATLYNNALGLRVPVTADDISWKCPGGGLESTAPDLCRFALQLMDGSLLKDASRQQLWTARKLTSGKVTSYGLGWVIGSTNAHAYVAHSGSQLGAKSYLRIYPEEEIIVVILSNCRSHRPQDLGDALSQRVLAQPNPTRRFFLRRR
ncbi:MAG: serine hydrolase domain-containing protein [Pirellulaceae bacterium]